MPRFPRTAARSAALAASLGLATAFLAPLAGPVPAAVAAPADEPATAAPEGAGASPEQGSESGGAGGSAERSGADGVGTDRGAGAGAGATTPSGGAFPHEAAPVEGGGASPQDADDHDFPGNGGPTRIHVMAFAGADAIILESGGKFAFVDSGEDDAVPDGKDPRYPLRPGIAPNPGYERDLWAYLNKIGVKPGNVEFYLGTHAHSDHIGTADAVIRKYKPKRIYAPEYSDEWITDRTRLWDNQWVYDRMVAAARKAETEYGAEFIQHLDPNAPVDPAADAPGVGSPNFDFGGTRIQIMNYSEGYKKPPYVYDANLMAWGVKVTAHGKSAFLAADIENTDGAEDRLASQIGKVDFLKLGHHGLATSNSEGYLRALDPEIAIQTGLYSYLKSRTAQILDELGARLYTANEIRATGNTAIVVTLSDRSTDVSSLGAATYYRWASWGHRVTALRNGVPVGQNGWKSVEGVYVYFERSPYAVVDRWLNERGTWYYLKPDGIMATGWTEVGGAYYHFTRSGAMEAGKWIADDGQWYYLTGTGAAATGWTAIGGYWYYMDPGTAQMRTGWVQDAGTWYYLADDGTMRASTWLSSGGRWYRLGADGAMATDWAQVGGSWYYLDPTTGGAMATGWARDRKGDWYFFESSGAMRSSQWVRTGSDWFYLGSSGAMVKGWAQVGGSWFYLDPGRGGAMVVDGAVINGRLQRFDVSGRWLG